MKQQMLPDKYLKNGIQVLTHTQLAGVFITVLQQQPKLHSDANIKQTNQQTKYIATLHWNTFPVEIRTHDSQDNNKIA